MCVVSMVYDYYKPIFPQPDDWHRAITTIPLGPVPTPAEMQKLIDDFKKAAEAAKTVDEKTGQPDCADPEKAKLEARVAELEKRIAELEAKPAKVSKPKKTKRGRR